MKKYHALNYEIADYFFVLLAFLYPIIVYFIETLLIIPFNLSNGIPSSPQELLIQGMVLSICFMSFGLINYIDNPSGKAFLMIVALFYTVIQFVILKTINGLNLYFYQTIVFFIVAHGVLHFWQLALKNKKMKRL